MAGAGVSGYFVEIGGSSPQYRFASAELGPLTAAVSASGNLNAVITVQVGSQVSGQIKELLVDFNSVVKKGQVIARIDPDIFEAKVIQARADLDSAKATVLNQQAQVERSRADVGNARAAHAEARAQTAKAQVAVLDTKRDFDRKTELFARQLIAKSDLDTSKPAHDSAAARLESARAHEQALASAIQSATAQLRVAEAMLVSARAQVEQKDAGLKQAQVDLDHTTIRAPVQGVVVSRQVDVGQTVAASLQAPVLFTIAQDLTKMQVETSVDEADIGRIKLDDRATFTVDAFPGETFEGTVTQIRKAGQIVRRHAGQELPRRVVHGDDDRVRHDVLHDLPRLPDLRDGALERLARKRVHCERGTVVEFDAPDIRLVHASLDLHLRQVLGDREEHRRLQARRNGLADIHLARDHDALHRRADRGVIEIHLGLLEAGVFLLHLRARRYKHGFRHAQLGDRRLDGGLQRLLVRPRRVQLGDRRVVRRLGRVEIALGDELAREQLRLPVEIALGVEHGDLRLRRLGARLGVRRAGVPDVGARALDLRLLVEDRGLGGVEVCPGLDDLRLEDVRIDPRDHLAFLHDRVEVDEELLDLARHLTAHLDGDDRVEVAAGRDGGGE